MKHESLHICSGDVQLPDIALYVYGRFGMVFGMVQGQAQVNSLDQKEINTMKLKFLLGRAIARSLSPQELSELIKNILPYVWKQIPSNQRVGFLKNAAHEHLGALLAGLNREERAALMNDLLPLAARELPLSDLDFLTSFSSPGGGYKPEASEA